MFPTDIRDIRDSGAIALVLFAENENKCQIGLYLLLMFLCVNELGWYVNMHRF